MRACLVVVVAIVALAVLAAHAQRAYADTDVGVTVAGEPTLQKSVQQLVGEWLEHHGYALKPAPLDADATTTLLNCLVMEDIACANGTFDKRSKAQSLVFARIELVGAHEAAVTGYWFVKDHDAVAEKRWCRKCDDAALRATVDELLTFLDRAVHKGRLAIHSKPEGLEVFVDDASFGPTPVERDIAPGPHRLELRRGAAVVAKRSVSIEPGSTAEVSLAAGVAIAPAPRWHKIVPLALVGAGVAAVIGGGVFFAYGSKGGPNAPLIYPHANRDGAILTATGAGAIVAGGVLWLHWTGHF